MENEERDRTNRAIDFTVHYGEMSAAYNERLMSFEPAAILEEGWTNEYISLQKEDLPYVLDIFEEEFEEPENEYKYLEVKAIRKWIGNKYLN